MNVAGHFSDCCKAVQRLLQGSSVNIAGQHSDCCKAVQIVAGQLSEYYRGAQ